MRGRWLTWVGVLLLVGGLAMLGYVGWQVFGTNYVSRQHQTEAVEQLQQRWEGQATVAPETTAPEGGATALIRIPRFGEDYVMPVFEGTTDEILAKGFGHFDEAAGPGDKGNYALAAHRVTHGEPLRDMPRLSPGDLVEVETRAKVFVYRVDTDPNDLVVTFREVWVVDPQPENPDGGVEPPPDVGNRLITLTTCAELFHTDDRMVAFGHLVQARRK